MPNKGYAAVTLLLVVAVLSVAGLLFISGGISGDAKRNYYIYNTANPPPTASSSGGDPCPGTEGCCCNYGYPGCASGFECRGLMGMSKGACVRAGSPANIVPQLKNPC